jgi:hypothetical protein
LVQIEFSASTGYVTGCDQKERDKAYQACPHSCSGVDGGLFDQLRPSSDNNATTASGERLATDP